MYLLVTSEDRAESPGTWNSAWVHVRSALIRKARKLTSQKENKRGSQATPAPEAVSAEADVATVAVRQRTLLVQRARLRSGHKARGNSALMITEVPAGVHVSSSCTTTQRPSANGIDATRTYAQAAYSAVTQTGLENQASMRTAQASVSADRQPLRSYGSCSQ